MLSAFLEVTLSAGTVQIEGGSRKAEVLKKFTMNDTASFRKSIF
jgi:hypothetical protein